jgi:hypothetical protein
MDEGLNSGAETLQDQAEKINVALYYVNGDMEKARQMVAGTFTDLYALKGRFVSSSLNGAFLLFFNKHYNKLSSAVTAVMPSYFGKEIQTAADWKVFEKDLLKISSGSERDEHLGTLVKNKLYESFNSTFSTELSRFLESKNTIALERVFQKLIQFILNLQRIDIKVDYQQISSLEMELYSSSSPKVDKAVLDRMAKSDDAPAKETDHKDPIRQGMEGVKLVLKASLILAPVKGKDIALLQPGDRVKVAITENNPKAVTIAQALDAYKDGVFSPLTARIKHIEARPNAGYAIYAIIAKGIYVKIMEEEANIKVAMDAAYEMARADSTEGKGMNVPALVIIAAVFIGAVALILFLVL